MPLTFPKPDRRYDAERRRIRFWGYDDNVEIPFFVDESVIFRLAPRTANAEVAMLDAFDAVSERIFAVALKVYQPGQRRSYYQLTPSDF